MATGETLQTIVRSIINIFRYIFEDDKALVGRIDRAYEETLIEELALIPKEFEEYVLNYVRILREAYNCFNVVKFNEALKRMGKSAFPVINIDSYQLFMNGLDKIALSKANKARIKNMVGKFEPLFVCANHMINDTSKTIQRLALRAATSNLDDLL